MTKTQSPKPSPISRSHQQFLLFFIGIILPIVVLVDLAHRVARDGGFGFDLPTLNYIHQFAGSNLDKIAIFLTNLGSPVAMGFVAALVLIILIWKKRYYASSFFALAVGGAGIINLLAKPAFHRLRPELWPRLVTEVDFSFPSGHAMGSMAPFLALLILLWPTKWRYLTLATGLIFVAIIGLTRLYLGVHYPSDVLAGWLTSIVWVTIIYSLCQPLLSKKG